MQRLFALISMLLVVSFVVGACGPTATPTPVPAAATPVRVEVTKEVTKVVERVVTATPAPPPPTPAPAPKGKVTLKFIVNTSDTNVAAYKDILAAFQKSQGGTYAYVDIAFDAVPFADLFAKIETSIAAGAEVDLIQADGPDIKHYAFNRVIIPLDQYFTAADMKLWAPQSIEEGSFRGKFYGPPIMQSCSLMMYNVELTDAAGVKPPQKLADSWTMQQALDAWQKTTRDANGDGVPEVWGLRWGQGVFWSDYEHGLFRRSAGDKASNAFLGIDKDGVTLTGYLDDPAAVEGMQFYQDLHQKYKVTPIEPIPQVFETKKAAFIVTPDNRIGDINRLYPADGSKGTFKWGVTGIPYFRTQLCHTGSWHYGISTNSKNSEEAVAFVKFATSDEGARIWFNRVKQLPANVNLYNEIPEYRAGGIQGLWAEAFPKIGEPRIQTPGYTEYQQVFAEAARDISQGAAVAARLKQAAATATSLLRKYKGWNQ